MSARRILMVEANEDGTAGGSHQSQFDLARSHLELATTNWAATDHDEIETVWFTPNDPIAEAYMHLACLGLVLHRPFLRASSLVSSALYRAASDGVAVCLTLR